MEESVTYQMILEKGEAKGEARGIDQGRTQEARSLLLKLGQRRFGKPSQAVLERINATAALGRLETMIERIVDAAGWDALLKD